MRQELDPGELLYRLQREVRDDLAAHVLANAMLHAKGWWNPSYRRSTLAEFFKAVTLRPQWFDRSTGILEMSDGRTLKFSSKLVAFGIGGIRWLMPERMGCPKEIKLLAAKSNEASSVRESAR